MELMGIEKNTVKWIESYLSERHQRVQVGSTISDLLKIQTGSPQGGKLSPLLYLILVSDMHLWLEEDSSLFAFADDSTVSCKDDNPKNVIEKLERNAQYMLEYLSSNALLVNTSKTIFIMVKPKQNTDKRHEIQVGNDIITESEEAKLLGTTINNKLTWQSHIIGPEKLLSNLRRRMFMLKQTKGRIPQKNLLEVARAIFISKWQYGISVYGIFRAKEEQPKSKAMNKIQVLQNHMLRMLSLKLMPTIKWGTKKLCEYYGVLSHRRSYVFC